jgi:hypothetical protein
MNSLHETYSIMQWIDLLYIDRTIFPYLDIKVADFFAVRSIFIYNNFNRDAYFPRIERVFRRWLFQIQF